MSKSYSQKKTVRTDSSMRGRITKVYLRHPFTTVPRTSNTLRCRTGSCKHTNSCCIVVVKGCNVSGKDPLTINTLLIKANNGRTGIVTCAQQRRIYTQRLWFTVIRRSKNKLLKVIIQNVKCKDEDKVMYLLNVFKTAIHLQNYLNRIRIGKHCAATLHQWRDGWY